MKQMKLVFFLLIALFFPFPPSFVTATKSYTPDVPAIYVFGDSTADVGNNNYLPGNSSKANFPHYGIDFPHSRPTGRFSNGYNSIDFIAINMGFRRSPPPYLSLNDTNSNQILKGLRGVNFASAASGILDSTGATITMTKQIQYFDTLRSKMLNESNVALRISKSVYLFSAGGNDIFAFFLASNNMPNSTAVGLFYNTVVSKYENHIKSLYSLGARKFAVINVPPTGCTPFARVKNPTGACIDGLNLITKGLNDAIASLFARLVTELPSLKYSIGSSFDLISSVILDPYSFGLKEVESACCGGGKFNAESLCTPNSTYCMNRKQYLFWDFLHPTQATSKLVGSTFYNGPAQFISPITYKQLVESDG
ncbi:hypothetical protein LUZ60_009425 [Juncus effusus]|nr:hypothetical protein LUZ60_009425 [Juncus effusus]